MTGKVPQLARQIALERRASMRPGHYDREGFPLARRVPRRAEASMRPGHYDREGSLNN